nr:hypothetical protein [Tanacetum cinerariifolium]
MQDFVPMGSKEEGEIFKRKWLRLEQESAKKGSLNQLWALVKETLNIKSTANDKEKELWVELKRLYEPDVEDLLVNSPSFSGMTVPLFPSMLVTMSEGSGTPTEPHHTQAIPSPQHELSSSSLPPAITETIPTVLPANNPLLGEACPTISGLEAEQDRANITKTSTLPSESTPEVTSLATDKGSMQQKLNELMYLCTMLQRQQDEMASKITAQDLEISQLKARVKLLEDREGGVPTGSGSIPATSPLGTGVPTGSGMVPTASPIFTTAIVATPYTKRKGKEKMVESETPKKKKI